MTALLKGSLQTRRQREKTSGQARYSQELARINSFLICGAPQACQSLLALKRLARGFSRSLGRSNGLGVMQDVSSARLWMA